MIQEVIGLIIFNLFFNHRINSVVFSLIISFLLYFIYYKKLNVTYLLLNRLIMIKQFFGIKYPFSEESDRLTFFDMNETKDDGVKSKLLHIILTPKGQRLRRPEFGTDLIKFVFEPNDNDTWDKIKEEIRRQVSFYLPEVIFNNVNIIKDSDNDNNVYLEIDYSVEDKGHTTKNKTLVKL